MLRRIILHTLLYPRSRRRRLLLHLLWVLHQLLHFVGVGHILALLDARSRSHLIFPSLHVGVVLDVDSSPAGGSLIPISK